MSALGISEILPGKLYLGSANGASNRDALTELGVTHILNMAREQKCHFPEKFKYMKVSIYDGTEKLSNHLENAIAFIDSSECVFVHCKQGKSRSASVVIAYLMHKNGWSYQEAITFVKEKRKEVKPHFNFNVALCQLEEKLKGLSC